MTAPGDSGRGAPGKRIIVFGASGQVGRALLPKLVASGCAVLAFSRQPASEDGAGVEWRCASLPNAVPDLPDSHALISLGPLDLFVQWMQRQSALGSSRITALSSMSAVSKLDSPLAAERELAARLLASERALIEHCGNLGMGWTVLRPTMIYGAGMDRSVAALRSLAGQWRWMPLPRAEGLRQPVHVADLAAAVFAAANSAHSPNQCIEIGGGERLPVAEMFARIRASVPRRSVPIPLPRAVIRLSALLASRSSTAAKLSRFEQDLTADNTNLQRVLDIHPRAFVPAASSESGGPGSQGRSD